MKQQLPCPAMCLSANLPGFGIRPEDAARLFRLLLRPLLIGALIVLLGAALLLGGRALAPFVNIGAVGNPAHFAMQSPDQERKERELQAEMDRLLASFESAAPVEPNSQSELP